MWVLVAGCGAPDEFVVWPGATWDELAVRWPDSAVYGRKRLVESRGGVSFRQTFDRVVFMHPGTGEPFLVEEEREAFVGATPGHLKGAEVSVFDGATPGDVTAAYDAVARAGFECGDVPRLMYDPLDAKLKKAIETLRVGNPCRADELNHWSVSILCELESVDPPVKMTLHAYCHPTKDKPPVNRLVYILNYKLQDPWWEPGDRVRSK